MYQTIILAPTTPVFNIYRTNSADMDIYEAMLLLTNLLSSLSRYILSNDNQHVAVIMFNATLDAREFVISGEYFYQVVSFIK